mgnify:CR=1 FL=1
MRIIDSHVHFWHPETLRYTWLDEIDLLNKPFLPDDFDAATGDIDVEGIVFVQADCDSQQAVDEVEWVASLDERIQAIVAFAPLENGNAARLMLEKLTGYERVKGVRRLIQSEASGFARQPDFIKGVQSLSEYNLSFDICVYHHQLPDVLELVKQCPDICFVLDHAGKPGIKAGLLDPWRGHISQLAQFDNVCCKISGMITEADHQNWSEDSLKPYIEHLLNTFGTERLMFGSDFPVMNLAGDYLRWFNTLQSILTTLTEAETTAIYYENARSFYKIEDL